MKKIIVLLMFILIPFVYSLKIDNFVVDEANVIDKDVEAELTSLLEGVYKRGKAQMAIVTIPKLPENREIREYALELSHEKLGEKEKDNGLLMLVSLEEKKYTIEVGYGLEGVLNDALVGRIARNEMVPYFKQGDYGKGILSATKKIIEVIEGKVDENYYIKQEKKGNIIALVFVVLFITVFLFLAIKYGRKGRGGYAAPLFVGPGFGSGSSGISFGSGGFGGGGASGGW